MLALLAAATPAPVVVVGTGHGRRDAVAAYATIVGAVLSGWR